MESDNKFKEIDIKHCACYYFDDIMRIGDFGFNNILLDKKSNENSYENTLIYDILYKNFMSEKPLRIRFDKIDRFIKPYDGTRYLLLFRPERYDVVYDRIRGLICDESGIKYSISYYFAKIRTDTYSSLPIEKTLTIYNTYKKYYLQ